MSRVLIVDDDDAVAQSVADMLGDAHEVRMAMDGDDAMACAIGFVPDVVLMDIGMPGVNGFEAVRRLRNLFARSVYVIAFSGQQELTAEQLRAAGFDAFLCKPASVDQLLDAVDTNERRQADFLLQAEEDR
jgi:two-component system CheB/CheR fusion protein